MSLAIEVVDPWRASPEQAARYRDQVGRRRLRRAVPVHLHGQRDPALPRHPHVYRVQGTGGRLDLPPRYPDARRTWRHHDGAAGRERGQAPLAHPARPGQDGSLGDRADHGHRADRPLGAIRLRRLGQASRGRGGADRRLRGRFSAGSSRRSWGYGAWRGSGRETVPCASPSGPGRPVRVCLPRRSCRRRRPLRAPGR